MGPKTLALKQLCQSLGRKYVGFRGDPHSPIWIVGEAPGADEDQLGVPFVGTSGRELDRMLAEAGIPTSFCCFVNPYKVRPPDNDIERIEEVGIARQVFIDQFFEELGEYKPSFICPVGGTPLSILCSFTIDPRDKDSKISKWRGSLLVSEELRWPHYVIPNYHPAYILREWSDRAVTVFIFARLKEELDAWIKDSRHSPLPERELIADPSFGESKEYLEECLVHPGPISVDIELLARRVPICISFSHWPSSAISISLLDGGTANLRILWRLIDAILTHKWIVGQNYTTFDANWLNALGFSVNINSVDDTLVQHHVLHPEMSHKLDFLGMQYTRQPYWKDEGRGWTLRDGMKQLRRYNALDSSVTLEVFLRQTEELLESSGQKIGINELLSQPSLAAGFGLERQTDEVTRGAILRGVSSDSSIEFLSKISNVAKSYTTVARLEDASILGTESLSQNQSTSPSIENKELIAEEATNLLKKTLTSNQNQEGDNVVSAEGIRTGFAHLYNFYRFYEMPLARSFYRVDRRGLQTDPESLSALRKEIVHELDDRCVSISTNLGGRPVVYSTDMGDRLARQLKIDSKGILNIASVQQLKEVLKNELKIKLKTVKNQKGEYKESTGEESLNEAFAATGNAVLKDILRVRELTKIKGTYVDARLCNNVFYSCYSVTGTVTGRRASRKNFLGFGSNGQNQPKHSDLGERFNGVFVARRGRIYIACDQASAEEWIVQGIIADVSGITKGIEELKDSITSGISRHARLASAIFGLPLEKTNNKECIEYYVGKKVRHAGNYGMQGDKMAAVMASEGFPTNKQFCEAILEKFHQVEPTIRQVFHKYVEHELCTKRVLRTPLGRERTFYSLRPYGDNGKIFREGYAYIPQSTIGDNNGFSILWMEQNAPGLVLADGHDSMLIEVEDALASVCEGMKTLLRAYDRVIRFPNGFEVKIPIDFRIGYDLKGLKKCPAPLSEAGLTSIATIYQQLQSHRRNTTGGAGLVASQLPSSETSGSTVLNGSSTLTSTSSSSDVQV